MSASALEWTLPTPKPSGKADIALIPHPVKVEWKQEDAWIEKINVEVAEGFSKEDQKNLIRQSLEIFQEVGLKPCLKKETKAYKIFLKKGEVKDATIPQEAYLLNVEKKQATITASSSHGLFNGLQTLRQLCHKKENKLLLANCKIQDWPAFKVRGVMLDVGRNYLSPQFIKQQIKELAHYKINVLHFHCTEDPAWRLQIKKYPKLTQAQYHWKTRQPGKHYTQEEIKDLVAFCKKLHVEVIPEIDMPGHSEAFRHAMGVDMQSEKGVKILKDIIDEVVTLFPSQAIHIGSDEVPLKMKTFIPTMVEYVRSKGKEAILWSPGLTGDDKMIKMHWGDHTGHQVDSKTRHISTIGFYMDWVDSQSGVYQYFFQQPCDVSKGNEKAMGAITCVWTDGALSDEKRILEQYPFYPCSLTFAERLWRGANQSRPDLFAKLPQPNTPASKAFSEFENRLILHRDKYFRHLPFAYVKQSHIPWKLIGPFDHKGKNDTSFEPEKVIKESYQDGQIKRMWREQPAWGSAIHIRHFYSVFNLHYGKTNPNYWPATMNEEVKGKGGTCYALTYIHSPTEKETHLMFGIGGQWGHSGGYRTVQAPPQGKWDFSGGCFWLNDKKITPPKWKFESLPWTGWRQGRIEESPLTEEGYFFAPL